jgi:hypothetical protein
MPEDITDRLRQARPDQLYMIPLWEADERGIETTLKADVVLDITDICEATLRNLGQTVIKFGRSPSRGRVAQIQDRRRPGSDLGKLAHFYLDETTMLDLTNGNEFLDNVYRLECDSMRLAVILFDTLPPAT